MTKLANLALYWWQDASMTVKVKIPKQVEPLNCKFTTLLPHHWRNKWIYKTRPVHLAMLGFLISAGSYFGVWASRFLWPEVSNFFSSWPSLLSLVFSSGIFYSLSQTVPNSISWQKFHQCASHNDSCTSKISKDFECSHFLFISVSFEKKTSEKLEIFVTMKTSSESATNLPPPKSSQSLSSDSPNNAFEFVDCGASLFIDAKKGLSSMSP